MAAGQHQRVDAPRPVGVDDPLAGQRIDPAIGEKQPGAGELDAAHAECALVKIRLQAILDRF